MALHIPFWAIPLVVTVLAFGLPSLRSRNGSDTYGVGALMDGVGAIIVSLVAWLIYFIAV